MTPSDKAPKGGVNLTWERMKEVLKREMERPPEPPMRIIGPKHYEVLRTMIEDGIISKPNMYPEFESEAVYAEFCKRMKEQ